MHCSEWESVRQLTALVEVAVGIVQLAQHAGRRAAAADAHPTFGLALVSGRLYIPFRRPHVTKTVVTQAVAIRYHSFVATMYSSHLSLSAEDSPDED